MKFKVKQSEIMRILSNASGFTQVKGSVSIYSYILLSIESNKLLIKSSSVVSGFHGSINVEAEEQGVIAVQADTLCSIIAALKEVEILEFLTDNEFLYITCIDQSINYKFRFVSAESFEYKDFEKFDLEFEFPKDLFLDVCLKSTSCLGNDPLRPYLSSVCATFEKNSVVFSSSDSRCLVKYEPKIKLPNIKEAKTVLIPGKFLKDIQRLDMNCEVVKISFNSSVFALSFDNSMAWTCLVKTSFPNTESLFKTVYDYSAELEIENFLKVLRRITIFKDDEAKRVCLEFDNSTLKIFSIDKEEQGSGSEIIKNIDYQGPSISFAVCSTYLQDELKLMNTKSFIMYFNDEKKPIKIEPSGRSDYKVIISTTKI